MPVRVCPSCQGVGLCWSCQGTGRHPEMNTVDCPVCRGNGVCPDCEGRIEVEEEDAFDAQSSKWLGYAVTDNGDAFGAG